jgi:hypothetical protein
MRAPVTAGIPITPQKLPRIQCYYQRFLLCRDGFRRVFACRNLMFDPGVDVGRARLSGMPLIILLIVLLILFGGGGYYMGPGVGYYGGGGLSLILALVIIYLIFGRGRSRL